MTNYATHSANGRNFLIVEVPKDASSFSIVHHLKNIPALKYIEKGFSFAPTKYIELPPATYRILFVAEQATEEQAAEVVETTQITWNGTDYTYYVDYSEDGGLYDEALGSLLDLIDKHFSYSNQNHLILEIC